MPRSKLPRVPGTVSGRFIAILAYFSVLCIIPLLFQKNNEFVLAHGKQGLVIFVAQVGVFVSHILLGTWVLALGWGVLAGLSMAGIVTALRGRFVAFPVLSRVAERIIL